MKTLFLSLTLISTSAFASIRNTHYEARHVKAIETAIQKSCGKILELTQVHSESEVIQVDQGIRDVVYKTVLTGKKRIDQTLFDNYTITVNSSYGDAYDHQHRDWGIYFVDSVKCEME